MASESIDSFHHSKLKLGLHITSIFVYNPTLKPPSHGS